MLVYSLIKKINNIVGIVTGVMVLLCAVLYLIDIILRRFHHPLGGTDEIAGYVMAITTSWGVSYALVRLAHVRIDLLRLKLKPVYQSILDLISMASFTAISWLITIKTWSVLSKTLASNSKANTPLETPLWIPQAIWWSGWAWLSVVTALLLAISFYFFLKKDYTSIDQIAGVGAEI